MSFAIEHCRDEVKTTITSSAEKGLRQCFRNNVWQYCNGRCFECMNLQLKYSNKTEVIAKERLLGKEDLQDLAVIIGRALGVVE